MTTIYKRIRKAYLRACPIISVATSDPACFVESLAAEVNGDGRILSFDVAAFVTVPAQPNHSKAVELAKSVGDVYSLQECLAKLSGMAGAGKLVDAVVVVHNAQHILKSNVDVQAIWNVRDVFKGARVMLVLMGPTVPLPPELQNDVIEFDEPLPTAEQLAEKIGAVCESCAIQVDSEKLASAGASAIGLTGFAAEQIGALNVSADGVDVRGIWADKCRKINDCPGLKVLPAQGNFDDIAGLDQVKGFLQMILAGEDKPQAIVFIDEIEKAMAGMAGDNTGVSQDQHGCLLQYMQDNSADGLICLGVAGAAKSELAKKAGAQAGIPTIQLDFGAMKGKHVGESEGRIRDALKVIHRVSGGKTLWIATSNNIGMLPPELLRRFKLGVWFFDIPTFYERQAIWEMYVAKNKLTQTVSREMLDLEWTGAEIRTCCEVARKGKITIEAAAKFIVPVSQSGASTLESLRANADGKYLSASYAGPYTRSGAPSEGVKSKKQSRRVDLAVS